MAHHKRGRRKKARAGCLMCKPHKMNGENKHKDSTYWRGEVHARWDMKHVE